MNDRSVTQIEEFLARYEHANSLEDVTPMADFYSDVFMFGGVSGTQIVKREDFLKVIPKRKQFFRSIGLFKSEVNLIEVSELNSKYLVAKTSWKMSFKKGADIVSLDAGATYVLEAAQATLKIVFQVDHIDLSNKVKELGLTT